MSKHWSRTRKIVATSALLGSLGVGGTGLALATSGTASAASTSTSATALSNGQKVHRFLRRHTVDATITVKTKKGYETLDLARGTVGSISSTSITVDSPNGTTLTAGITSQTKFRNTTAQQLTQGEKVGVLAYQGVARWVATPKATSSSTSSTGS